MSAADTPRDALRLDVSMDEGAPRRPVTDDHDAASPEADAGVPRPRAPERETSGTSGAPEAAVPGPRAPERERTGTAEPDDAAEPETGAAEAEVDGPPADDPEPGALADDDAAFPSGGLSERDRQILAFERRWWKYAGAKEQAIRELFDMSATRYYQLLNILIDRPEALECDPMLVKRLRRMRSQRQRKRAARRLGIRP